jgi:hypothetical protein
MIDDDVNKLQMPRVSMKKSKYALSRHCSRSGGCYYSSKASKATNKQWRLLKLQQPLLERK